ncbi:hypothetical protein PanWU01x14_201790, partial [Parasponia andersonii]
MLDKLGFPAQSISIVNDSITSASFSVIINRILLTHDHSGSIFSGSSWFCSSLNYLKLNVDVAALGVGYDYIKVCVVIQDSTSSVRVSLLKKIVGIFSFFLAECIAIKEEIMLVIEHNLPISS